MIICPGHMHNYGARLKGVRSGGAPLVVSVLTLNNYSLHHLEIASSGCPAFHPQEHLSTNT